MYTCGIIVESVGDERLFTKVAAYFQKERREDRPTEPDPIWHVRQYGIPRDQVAGLLPELAAAIKRGWYMHLFNIQDGVLYVVLKGRFFKLPLKRDASWDEMIAYGESVGLDRKWSQNVPLSV
ncbi:MAG: hypothetical protein IT443_10140 [Phycisphaeraceae bacterium]|nr:hypothetical protein [Phycisphaeraceae bacterium]